MTNNNLPGDARDTIREAWKTAILNGDCDKVWSMMTHHFSPDEPIDECERHPLIDLARVVPRTGTHAVDLSYAARLLIHWGAALTLPDHTGLFPADHGMLSANPLVAEQIVLGTLRHHMDNSRTTTYRPNFDAMFKTIVDEDARHRAYVALSMNIAAIQLRLTDVIEEGDILLAQMGDEVMYWDNLILPHFDDLPRPSKALSTQFHCVAAMTEKHETTDEHDPHYFTAEQIDDAIGQMRFIEWQDTRDLTP